jgi:hypothetical protein
LTHERAKPEIRRPKAETKSAIRNPQSAIPSDLDWIVMKCLEKDRTRRYETANGLAADIARHLGNEPVIARPPSALYRFQKSLQRNKLAFGAALLVFIAVVLAMVVLAVSNFRTGAAQRGEKAERQKSDAANRELRQTVRVLELQRAEDIFRAGDEALGAVHLAAQLRRDPSNHIAASRLVSALVHRNWSLPAAPAMRHGEQVKMVSFSPDGTRVLSVSHSSTARIWDAQTSRELATLQHADRIFSAQYSPDGARIVTASADGTARLWDGTSGAPLTPPLQHQGKVFSAEFNGSGDRIVTASADKTARIWDSATGALKLELRGHPPL